MSDFLNLKKGQIVGAHIVAATVTVTAQMFCVSRDNVSKVMTAFEKEGKMSSTKHKYGRKWKLSDRDRVTLNWIFKKVRRTKALKITTEPNEHL